MSAALTAAVVAATGFWGGPPPCGQPEITFAPLGQVDGYAHLAACRIGLDSGLQTQPDRLCRVVAHEYGHLHGRGHTPLGLMSPWVGGTTSQCAQLEGVRLARCERAVLRDRRLTDRADAIKRAAGHLRDGKARRRSLARVSRARMRAFSWWLVASSPDCRRVPA